MSGIEATVASGMGHLTSFVGTESLPALKACEDYYNVDADKELIGSTVPASEHSVMCAGGMDDEFETFKRLITEVYPFGFCSIVSDTWDYWRVIEEYLSKLKDTILSRNGRVIIRPDSGCPEDIICGYWTKPGCSVRKSYPGIYEYRLDGEEWRRCSEGEYYGTYYMLWKIFGGTLTSKNYKKLDPHIGLIYGDSITLERQKEIYERLELAGFCASNLVLGIGSYTYQLKSRDSLGFAMKATWCQIDGVQKEIFKKPKTDSGTKNSLKSVKEIDGGIIAVDQVSIEEEKTGLLETVFEDGKLVKETSLSEIRKRIDSTLC